MKQLTSIILLIGFSAWHPAVIAQPSSKGFVINGKVTSFEESLPLEGASIVVKGSSNITGTQADGTFSLLLAPADTILVVSLAGYEPKEIKTCSRSKQYDVVLKRSDKGIAVSAIRQEQQPPAINDLLHKK